MLIFFSTTVRLTPLKKYLHTFPCYLAFNMWSSPCRWDFTKIFNFTKRRRESPLIQFFVALVFTKWLYMRNHSRDQMISAQFSQWSLQVPFWSVLPIHTIILKKKIFFFQYHISYVLHLIFVRGDYLFFWHYFQEVLWMGERKL